MMVSAASAAAVSRARKNERTDRPPSLSEGRARGFRSFTRSPCRTRLRGRGRRPGRGRRRVRQGEREDRSEEHTSELSHVKISYAVFCLKKKTPYTPRKPCRPAFLSLHV